LANTYGRLPFVPVRGKGVYLWDSEGNRYLDFLSGIGVNGLGHGHPKLVSAIQKQAKTLIHVSNLCHIPSQVELGQLLTTISFADRVFFCNSGAEANEAAIKLARKYSSDRYGKGRSQIITMRNSFHGRTLATLSATGQEKLKKGFEPMVSGFRHVPFNNLEEIRKCLNGKICAVLLEPVQGEGGVYPAQAKYLRDLRKLCKKNDILLIFDEVQCGFGKTGKMFGYQHYGVKPDIMTVAKSLAGGVPIGAMLATKKVMDSFVPGTHAATFGGNPLACTAALATVKTIVSEKLPAHADRMGKYFLAGLLELKNEFPFITEIRGMGLLIGVQLNCPCGEIVLKALKRGLLVNCIQTNVLRFLPPLIVNRKQIDFCLKILRQIFTKLET